jgi:hypothetical protein
MALDVLILRSVDRKLMGQATFSQQSATLEVLLLLLATHLQVVEQIP